MEVLRADRLCKTFYSQDRVITALQEVSFSVHAGEVVCLIGASGSGKSTLLYCLNGLETLDSGTVSFRGLPVEGSRAWRRVRSRIGMVFQQFNLFPHLTVKGNLTLAQRRVHRKSREQAEKRAIEVLQQVNLSEKMDESVHRLSGGQQQRVAIARALASDPALLFFDEPTSALDPELVGEVLAVIRGFAAEGRTMLIVTHEMDFARQAATRVIFMDEGRAVEDLPAAQFFQQPQTRRARLFINKIS